MAKERTASGGEEHLRSWPGVFHLLYPPPPLGFTFRRQRARQIIAAFLLFIRLWPYKAYIFVVLVRFAPCLLVANNDGYLYVWLLAWRGSNACRYNLLVINKGYAFIVGVSQSTYFVTPMMIPLTKHSLCNTNTTTTTTNNNNQST